MLSPGELPMGTSTSGKEVLFSTNSLFAVSVLSDNHSCRFWQLNVPITTLRTADKENSRWSERGNEPCQDWEHRRKTDYSDDCWQLRLAVSTNARRIAYHDAIKGKWRCHVKNDGEVKL